MPARRPYLPQKPKNMTAAQEQHWFKVHAAALAIRHIWKREPIWQKASEQMKEHQHFYLKWEAAIMAGDPTSLSKPKRKHYRAMLGLPPLDD